MKPNNNIPVYQNVLTEQLQGHETRKKLYVDLEKELGMPVVSYYTSFYIPGVMIEDTDADMLEAMLQKMDLSKGLALMVNSPGGIGLSAERIINICKSYSETGEFTAIVPQKAKSAATMICLGASKIFMSKTSELGPVDPQITIDKGNNSYIQVALCNYVDSYNELVEKAVNSKGNLQPYLLQLSNYDAREIKEFEVAIKLSEDVSVRALESGMMSGKSKDDIKKAIKIFLTPEETKSHGRSIFYTDAKKCGLKIDTMDLKSDLWKLCYELSIRIDNLTRDRASKCVENKDISFVTSGR
jgi:ClpP class serine protease